MSLGFWIGPYWKGFAKEGSLSTWPFVIRVSDEPIAMLDRKSHAILYMRRWGALRTLEQLGSKRA
jgi:hypothetical protein